MEEEEQMTNSGTIIHPIYKKGYKRVELDLPVPPPMKESNQYVLCSILCLYYYLSPI